jgi:hypothetical protein
VCAGRAGGQRARADGRPLGADDFCRAFPTGGGRKRAAGINHLPEAEFDAFVERFEAAFRLD